LDKKQPVSEQEFEALIEQGDDVSTATAYLADTLIASAADKLLAAAYLRSVCRSMPELCRAASSQQH
jgi:hypothetical protein